MIYKTFDIALELKQTSTNPPFTVIEGDTGNRLRVTVTDGGSPVDLTGCRVIAVFSKATGSAIQDSGAGVTESGIEIGGAYNNEVIINVFPQSVAPGTVECELQIYSGDNLEVLITTARFNFKCNRPALSGGAIVSSPEYPLLVSLISVVQGFTHDEEERNQAELERRAEYQKWVNAEAEATALPEGSAPTVDITEREGKKIFSIGIPRADVGGAMLKSDYDTDNDGAVDRADEADHAQNADKLGGKLPSEYAPKSTVYPATLELTNWSGDNPYTYTLSVPGITAASNGDIRIAQTATDEQWSAFGEAQIRVTGQSVNTLTLTAIGEAPVIDIPVEVIYS